MPSKAYDEYQVIVPVWGEQYTGLCVKFMIPCLLSQGNIPAICGEATVFVNFCCPAETRETIENSQAFAELTSVATVRFFDNTDILADKDAKHLAMTRSIYRAFSQSDYQPGTTKFVFLNPDLVISEGLLQTVRSAIERGKKIFMITGLRTRIDQVQQRLAPFLAGNRLEVPGHDLSRIALDCLHPMSSAYIWNRDMYPASNAALIYIERPDGSLVQQNFHLHPLVLVAPERMPVTDDTIDGDFVEKLGLHKDDFEIVLDGEDAVMIEISGEPYAHPDTLRPGRRHRAADYAVTYVSDIHWWFFGHRVVFARGDTVDPTCPELDRLHRYITIHRPRSAIRALSPWLDRRVFRHVFRALAWLLTLWGPGASGRR